MVLAMKWTPEAIRDLRLRLGLTQAAFGQLVGVGYLTINRWENHPLPPTRPKCIALDTIVRVIEAAPTVA